MKTITSRIPDEDERFLSELEQDEQATRAEVLRRLISEAINLKRKEKAQKLLKENKISVRRAAEIANLTYVEALSLCAEIDSGYDKHELQKDLEASW